VFVANAFEAVSTQPRRTLLALAAVATAALAVVYTLAVRTAWGQRLDATALRGRHALRTRPVHAAARLLTTISVASIVLIGGAIIIVALVRARPRLAAGAATIIAGSTLTTELLKRVVLPRPSLGVVDVLRSRPSFPSGHTTIAMSLAIAAMLVVPSRWRAVVGVIGAAYAGAIGVALIATANHRPSDPIGAALVVTAWTGVVAAMLIPRDGEERREPAGAHASPWLALGGSALLLVAFVGLVATVVAIRRNRLDTIELGGAFAASATAIVGTVMLTTATLLAVLRGVPLDRPVVVAPRRLASDGNA
jgi:membrane-associated phospholipid phosphatase